MELFDFASESVIVSDAHGVIQYWNAASEALYGWPAMAMIGQNFEAFCAPGQHHAERTLALLREGRWKGVVRRRNLTGTEIAAAVRQIVRRGVNGTLLDIVEFGRNVGEMSQVATIRQTDLEDRKQAEVRKAAILESALDCIVTIDHEGRISEFNPAAERTFGYRRDEIVGKHLAEIIIPPSLREKHRFGFARYLATGEAHMIGRRIETKAMHADGREFPVELAITRIPVEGPPSFTGYLRDITERKQVEEKLRRSEAFLAEGQHLSQIGSFSWRVATNEITWSEQLYRIFEFEQGTPVTLELIGTRVHPDDIPLLHDMNERVRRAGDDFEYEHRLLMPDHSVKYLHLIAHARQDKDGRLEYIGAAQDVTQRRLSEEALAKARSELAHVARVTTLGELATSIAHEINQPLAAIVTNGETSLRWLARADQNIEKVTQLTSRIVSSARRAGEIIHRVRGMAAKNESEKSLVDLNEIVEEALLFMRHDIDSKSIVLSTTFGSGLPRVMGDRIQLQQVIINLLVNSVQAIAQSGQPTRRIDIHTSIDEEGSVVFSIFDNGPGIATADLPHVFDSFFSTKNTGIGIGLAICNSIITAHSGIISGSNRPNGGAHFRFTLPVPTGAEPDSGVVDFICQTHRPVQ
jgi:PAS domain S-box-containing protein